MKTKLFLAAATAIAFFAPQSFAAAPAPAPELPLSSVVTPIPGGGTIFVQALTRRGRPMCFGEVRLFKNGVCIRGPKLTDGSGQVRFGNLGIGHFEVRLRNYLTGRRGSAVQYLHRNQATWTHVQVR